MAATGDRTRNIASPDATKQTGVRCRYNTLVQAVGGYNLTTHAMLSEDGLVAVFRAPQASGNAEAQVLRSLLASAEIESVIRWTPPTFTRPGGVALMVLASQQQDAEELIRQARTEETMSDQEHPQDGLVAVFRSANHDAESEADTVHALLSSAGLESTIVRQNVPELPTGGVQVRVLARDAEAARNIIAAARKAGSE